MMLMPASAEFAALCRSQIAIAAQAVGADSTAVYLAERFTEQALPKLTPIAIYPSSSPSTQSPAAPRQSPKILPGFAAQPEKNAAVDPPKLEDSAAAATVLEASETLLSYEAITQSAQSAVQQLAIPLVHEGGVMGVLVSWRADRPWHSHERDQMEECARALALACVLDQRGQWLQTQLSALDRVQTQQSDRFHDLLHQLKSPLTALKTFGKLLTKRLTLEDKNQSLVLNMMREGDRMQELLGYFDDTLRAADQTRTETAQPVPLLAPAGSDDTTLETPALPVSAEPLAHFGGTLHLQPCAVAALIAPLVDSAQALADGDGTVLHVSALEPDLWVRADTQALVEVLSNFLDNALKYSPPGTHIWLQWGLARNDYPHCAGILVGDTGPGIPEADQPRIFERYYRGVQASGSLSGSGLGLAIAQDLIQEMQGLIEVYSPLSALPWPIPEVIPMADTGAGTAFVIWLPRAQPTD